MIARAAVLLLLLVGAPARGEDSFAAHYDAGVAAYHAQRYTDALRELEAAYALRQHPPVLFEIARCHVKLGRAREAVDAFSRWRVAEPDPTAAQREEADRETARLRPLVPPAQQQLAPWRMPAGVQLMPVRFEERRNRGLIGGGIALLGIGYLPALITGAMIGTFETGRSRSDPDGDIAAASWVLLLPVAGPFISGLVYRGAFWALPWILVDGAAQVSGLALLVVGAMRREKVPVFIAPMAVAGGTGLALAGDF